jgi:hypothetical protein
MRLSRGHPLFASEKGVRRFEEFKSGAFVSRQLFELFLKDPRFILTPYVGKFGWVSLRVTRRR